MSLFDGYIRRCSVDSIASLDRAAVYSLSHLATLLLPLVVKHGKCNKR